LLSGAAWKGASAEIVIISGQVNSLTIMDPGSGYSGGETLNIDPSGLGGGVGASITITADDIESSAGFVLQITGGGLTTPDSYAPIVTVDSTTSVSIANSSIVSGISTTGMYALPTDSGTPIAAYSFDSTSGVSTFTADPTNGFGMQRGNSFVAFDSNGYPLGKYYVSSVPSPNIIETKTNSNLLDVALVGKCGYEDNDANTGSSGENIGIRGTAAFDLGVFYLETNSGTGNVLTLSAKDGGVTGKVAQKLPLGRYLQIGSEIIRVASTTFGGLNLNEVTVIRGALGTNIINHPQYSKVRAISPLAIELRRPSILRASGHTFEYLGYGPGNYSTALPQLQVEQLPDEEVFLVQAQELSCGQVVYTGMSDNGDFYIGNTKYSATSGTQTTFDVPIPTVAGQNASSNNVVFDEVIVNQRLFVAGGEANEVLSQFDGPVKFTQSVNIENALGVTGNSSFNTVDILSQDNAISLTDGGALTIRGGASVGKDLYIGGTLYSTGDFSTNVILAAEPDSPISLFENQNSGLLGIGSQPGKVVFNTNVDATGEGGDDIAGADAGVVVEGGLVVRGTLLAGEVKANGLGKPGTVIMWGGSINNVPEGYLLCNGAAYNKNTYNKLFDAIGTIHGGSGNNFNVPDLRDRFIVGAGSQYNTADQGGSDTVTLTEAELANHTHVIENTNLEHTHSLRSDNGATANVANDATPLNVTGNTDDETGLHIHTGATTNNRGSHSHGINDPGHSHEVEAARQGGEGADGEPETREFARNSSRSTTSERTGISIQSNGNHTHSVTVPNNNSEHNHSLTATGTATHNHTLGGRTATSLGNHDHTAQTTGDDVAHENRPPYYALVYLIQYK